MTSVIFIGWKWISREKFYCLAIKKLDPFLLWCLREKCERVSSLAIVEENNLNVVGKGVGGSGLSDGCSAGVCIFEINLRSGLKF